MKNILAGIAAVSVAGGIVADVEAAPNQTEQTQAIQDSGQNTYTVNVDGLRVRTGPSTSDDIIDIIQNGQSLQVTGEINNWYKINHNGQTAYVSKDFVTAAGKQTGSYSVNVSSLRVRTGPSTSHSILGALAKGENVDVIGEVENWYKISYNGQTAYVSKDYVSSNTQQPPKLVVETKGMYTVTVDALRIRKGPASYHAVIGGVNKGDTLEVIGIEDGWYKVKYNGTTGYASAEYLQFAKTAPVSTTDYYVTVNALNVRSGAGKENGIVGVVTQGQKVQASQDDGEWMQINYDGGTGYVAKQFLSKTPTNTTNPGTPSTGGNTALITYAQTLEGVPYAWGGTTPSGFDCSGFIYHVYSKFGFSFGRSSTANYWNSLTQTTNPQPGDLVYFQNTYKPGPSHVGIYLGNNAFIHASDNGITISNMSSSYWTSHFLGYTKPY